MSDLVVGTKTAELNKLFEDWKQQYAGLKIDTTKFSADGIICEDKYDAAKKKILFVLRETNDFPEGDLRVLYRDGPKLQMAAQLSKWATGILYDFPDYSEVDMNENNIRTEAIKSIAIMNVKKYTGGAIADFNLLHVFTKLDKDLIKREIDIIKPQIIVCCNTFIELMWALDLELDMSDLENIFGKSYIYNGARIVVWQHHPSDRGKHSENYDRLKKLFQKTGLTKEFAQ
ncbi:MAG: hypothetical protein CVT49_00900 [candidate division Zixibacteria bacterium HGW-Zixibacteria-1]|nr:MAG: hypothetical protein CVT49_00900 [candidate division Zixibacteria bacterium HGW-Zixibacteria-1]